MAIGLKNNIKKTAVVYDKWLSTLGGGEVVACNFTKALHEVGYETTFIAGNLVDPKIIKDKLKIDLTGINFIEVWNDEDRISQLTENTDIFVNASYMDYTLSKSKHNYYYTSFPTKANNNPKAYIINNILLPLLSKHIKPVEFSSNSVNTKEENGHLLYQIDKNLEVKFSYLKPAREYLCKFSIFYPLVSKYSQECTKYELKNASLTSQNIRFDHLHNVIHYELKFIPNFKTTNLNIIFSNFRDEAYLINPRIITYNPINKRFLKLIEHKFINRLRAGFFYNIKGRMKKFDLIFANSSFTQKWIKKYWNTPSTVLYPPVSLIKSNKKIIKNNQICSVGRFFTLGHGKKQEIMVNAFKQLCDKGLKEWELHLAGGLGNEESSQNFMKELQNQSKGYPIFFHINCSRKEIENIYLSSKIYWHATGFGENQDINPIKFEHFGIAPIEAISAKCVPVLFNGGGLPDTVKSFHISSKKYLFNSIPELIDKTEYIILNYNKQSKIINKIQKKLLETYSEKAFKNKFIKQITNA
ncbi:MAG: hypothetical protein US68_C0030G0001 [Candidatus Shapirobacteria bacterium GW2011_GWE1_38_10]|uniref:Glycosyl transferase family 1 domain-containing protein n=1 Tax=Candidatus Shapirobacteria bacterium GW2011_GWE1_38_10 TaxID=1618488 RepID=A0A0G0KH56_9BACT|nr:MAG: hypothetical protein US46_C0002G0017 [Candidatus Shapirobacteria bacterium GW2011_GWF2_37_20]KKQ48524.1 MAG: hypothetical protein US68_C0030G0001 [Candidatus Shapirobacteria bacterium GW2011_GWE1_38_10]KKQ64563.1 MAG: hypothetical protein US85_C0007G0020 [Candidatus Shapirobacteria bacterium GW2011_GWF1_38_23]